MKLNINIAQIFKQTLKRLKIFSITKKIVLLIIISYLAIGGLFYQYTQKVSSPTLLAHKNSR